jgi:hypothetical protein
MTKRACHEYSQKMPRGFNGTRRQPFGFLLLEGATLLCIFSPKCIACAAGVQHAEWCIGILFYKPPLLELQPPTTLHQPHQPHLRTFTKPFHSSPPVSDSTMANPWPTQYDQQDRVRVILYVSLPLDVYKLYFIL